MQLDPAIYIFVVVPDALSSISPMQGFSMSLCENSWIVHRAALLPANIYELSDYGRRILVAQRMSGTSPIRWYAQSPRAIRAMALPASMAFTLIILPESESAADYEKWANTCSSRPTIVAKSGGDLPYEDLNIEALQAHFLQVCERIPKEIDPDSVNNARVALKEWKQLPIKQLGYQVGGHNSIAPNVLALHVAGFDDVIYGPFKAKKPGVKAYVDQIVLTTNSIFDERAQVGHRDLQRIYRPPPDLNLFAPNIFPHFFQLPPPAVLNRDEKTRFTMVLSALKNQSGYMFEANTEAQIAALVGKAFASAHGKSSPTNHPLMLLRAQEQRLATNVVGALAASEFSAVVRLPNDVNRTSGAVRSFSEHYRSDMPNPRKRLKTYRSVQARLASAVPIEFMDLIQRSTTGIRIISDAHLEWLNLDGLPLTIRKNCTRIPATPGNLFVETMATRPLIHLTPSSFRKVLVISALKRSDPVSRFFDTAFQEFSPHWRIHLDVRSVTVSKKSELLDALNEFDGPMVIFDGHGTHNAKEAAKLHLQDEAIDIWSLKDEIVNMPPIVVLSACDTHAADRNHATTANGFMMLGARTVLSSVFPLHAAAAATFAARLIYRVAAGMKPMIDLFDEAITWTEVVSGMIRMQLLTDFLHELVNKKVITKEIYEDIGSRGNMAINGRLPDPFGFVVSELAKMGLPRQLLLAELERAVANSSAISYLQIGRPETILIDDENRIQRQLSELAKIAV